MEEQSTMLKQALVENGIGEEGTQLPLCTSVEQVVNFDIDGDEREAMVSSACSYFAKNYPAIQWQ